MTSKNQLTANRGNALKSTGPRSLAGKSRSRFNAVQHGLTADIALLPGEDPAEYQALRRATFSTYYPQGALENQLVERAVSLIWRMRRIPAFEVALLEWTAYYQAQVNDADDWLVSDTEGEEPVYRPNDPDSIRPLEDLRDGLKLGRVIEALLSTDMTARLARYERDTQRNLTAIFKELRDIAKARPPLAIPPKTDNQP